jgi:hypothetical protein
MDTTMPEPDGEDGANFGLAVESDTEPPTWGDGVSKTRSVGVLIAPIYPTVATVAFMVGSVTGVAGVIPRVLTSMEIVTGRTIHHCYTSLGS